MTAHTQTCPILPTAPCRPCSDTEVLLAVCTSDFGECSGHPLGVSPSSTVTVLS